MHPNQNILFLSVKLMPSHTLAGKIPETSLYFHLQPSCLRVIHNHCSTFMYYIITASFCSLEKNNLMHLPLQL